MLGVFSIRDALVGAYDAGVLLGVASSARSTALVMRGRERKLAIVVDDVEDVATILLDDLADPPVVEADGLMLGVFRHNGRLVALLDADTLLAFCRADGATENA
jgi:chemotaxis signal transduction protein